MLRPTLLAAALLGGLLLLPASASAQQKMTLSVDVTGIHVVDWTYREKADPDPCGNWDRGSGTHTVGFSTPRPPRVNAVLHRGRLPAGVARLQFVGGKKGRWRIAAERKADFINHVPEQRCTGCGPTSEYGPCGPPYEATVKLPMECPHVSIDAPQWAHVTALPKGEPTGYPKPLPSTLPWDGVHVSVFTAVRDKFPKCPPDAAGHHSLALNSPEVEDVYLRGLRKIERLRVGRSVTLKGERETGYAKLPDGTSQTRGACGELGALGYHECAVTDVTVKFRRLR